ncbi:MAG: DUF3854 domain-containing protein [Planctomycetota bacterium]
MQGGISSNARPHEAAKVSLSHAGAGSHALNPDHIDQLVRGSGLDAACIRERGYFTATTKVELKLLGFSDAQRRVPALVIPLLDTRGQIASYQIRPDHPRIANGKPLKYESPSGSKPVIDVPPAARAHIADPRVPLWITEGSKKADAACMREICCIALIGVYGWRGKNEHGGTAALGDWESIVLNEREVIIAFDSDVMTKPQVQQALRRLAEFLSTRKAKVRFCILPQNGTEKVGLDDFFVNGGTVAQLRDCIGDLPPQPPAKHGEDERTWGPYIARANGIFHLKNTRDGDIEVQLTNFDARILRDITLHDGLDCRRQYEIETRLGGKTCRFVVAAGEFTGLKWVPQHLGASGIVDPGYGSQSRVPAAIQALSAPELATIYQHTGWMQRDQEWLYLSDAGALEANGIATDISVSLGQQTSLCHIASSGDPVGDVQCSLDFLNIAPLRVTVPMLLTIYRAAVGPAGFSLFIEGQTGTKKTALATLMQQHFGAGFASDKLPGSWSSTANSLEAMIFEFKDMVFVIDDFVAPAGHGREKLDLIADRVLRGGANGSARQRMNADGSMRQCRPPRSTPVVTGEQLPSGHSLRARMLIVAVQPADVDLNVLTRVQSAAGDGRLSGSMAAFIQWLAPRLASVRDQLSWRTKNHQAELISQGWHGRTVSNIAELLAMSEVFLQFIVDCQAMKTAQQSVLAGFIRQELLQLGAAQSEHHAEEDPVQQYFVLLRSAITGGIAHLCCKDTGAAPVGRERQCGWEHNATGWVARGQMVGYYSSGSIYLIPDLADKVTQELSRQRGAQLSLQGSALRRRLDDRGMLASTETRGGKKRRLVRQTVGGSRSEVLHLREADLLPSSGEVAQVSQSDACLEFEGGSDGPPPAHAWPTVAQDESPGGPADAEFGPAGPPPTKEVAQHNTLRTGALPPSGPLGPLAERKELAHVGPAIACWCCRDHRYWRAGDGLWFCARCHPPAAGKATEAWNAETGQLSPWPIDGAPASAGGGS